MAKLTKLEKDIAYVSALSDYPNSNDGMTSSQLKETFDKSSNDIKEFINNTLTEEIDLKAEEDANTYATKDELRDLQLGQLIDGTVTIEKLSEDVQERINKVDVVEENLNETKENLETLTKDTNSKLDNIYKYTIPTVEKVTGGNTVKTTSTLFGQITDTSTVTNPLVGTCIGNIDGETIEFNIESEYNLALSKNAAENTCTLSQQYNSSHSASMSYYNELLQRKEQADGYCIRFILPNATTTNALNIIWNLKKKRKVTLNCFYNSTKTTDILRLQGSDDGISWSNLGLISKTTDVSITSSTAYQYYRVNVETTYGALASNSSIGLFYLYLTDVDDSYYVPDNTNFFTLPYDLSNLNVNQRVLLETPSDSIPNILPTSWNTIDSSTENEIYTGIIEDDLIVTLTSSGASNTTKLVTNAFDGDTSTSWSCLGNTTGYFVKMEFNKPISIFKMNTWIAYNTSGITNGVYIQGSNDNNAWDNLYNLTHTQTTLEEITLNNSNEYKYYRIYGLSNDSAKTMSIYELQITGTNYGNYNIMSSDGVKVNKLNNIEVDHILQPSTKYELIYDGEKFIDEDFKKEASKVLYDITLTSAVTKVNLTGLCDKLENGKLYACIIYGSASVEFGVYFGNGMNIGYMRKSDAMSLGLFVPYINGANIKSYGFYSIGVSGGVSGLYGSFKEGTTKNEDMRLDGKSYKFNIGTRIIIKEV